MGSPTADGGKLPNAELRRRLDFDDTKLLAECEIDYHRVKGPGGQHRNKVASAVRLRHRPSGLVVTGAERRSQHENKANAVERLREGLALVARLPAAEHVMWPEGIAIRDGRLRVSVSNPAIHHVVALVLDAFATEQGKLKEAAARLNITPSSLTKFLADHPKAWRAVNDLRQASGLGPLHE